MPKTRRHDSASRECIARADITDTKMDDKNPKRGHPPSLDMAQLNMEQRLMVQLGGVGLFENTTPREDQVRFCSFVFFFLQFGVRTGTKYSPPSKRFCPMIASMRINSILLPAYAPSFLNRCQYIRSS